MELPPDGWFVRLFHEKSQSKMDDDWGTPISGNLHVDPLAMDSLQKAHMVVS